MFYMSVMAENKEKLSEVEQQLKKAEAAQRRRLQVEKAARESEVCSSLSLFFLNSSDLLNLASYFWFYNCHRQRQSGRY